MEGKQGLIIKHRILEFTYHLSLFLSALSPLKAGRARLLTLANLLNYIFSLLQWVGFHGLAQKCISSGCVCFGRECSSPVCSDLLQFLILQTGLGTT